MNDQLDQNTLSVSTRGRPKVVLEEGIINRYNIEFYLNVGGVIPCLENIAIAMGLSVLDLLKKLYQGEAVFKMSLGRSGKLDRKTVQLAYVPLTITFPFEKFKYINILEEYKTICSKYSDMTINLENTVESISKDLNAANERLDMIKLQNEELLNMKKSYEDILQSHSLKEQLFKQSQLDLAEAQAENQVLLQKINNLEALQLVSNLKDAEILTQLSEPPLHCQNLSIGHTIKREITQNFRNLLEPKLECQQNLNNSKVENTILSDKLRLLEEKSLTNVKIIEKIKMLEETVKVSDAEIKRFKEKIRKLEDLYLTDSQSLLSKIKMLEEELDSLKNGSLQSPKGNSKLECKKLRKQIRDLEELKSSENKKFIREIKRLYLMITSLNKQLSEEKLKNIEIQNSLSNTHPAK